MIFTPGPVSTTSTVKSAITYDMGSRDTEFLDIVKNIRINLLKLANVKCDDYTAILLQGSGTYAVEGCISSVVNQQCEHLLIIENGSYGKRMIEMAKVNKTHYSLLSYPSNKQPDLVDIEQLLKQKSEITHVAFVHSETSSGILNPLEIVNIAKKYGKITIVDAMSSFGCIPIDMKNIDFLISSPNKCIQGIPGVAFIISKKEELQKCRGNASSMSLDIFLQEEVMRKNGQFRFTPPIQVILGLNTAIEELLEEGIVNRYKRYSLLQKQLINGISNLFTPYLQQNHSPVVTAMYYPKTQWWNFQDFYDRLKKNGHLIYGGKVLYADCIRIGNIGNLTSKDMENFIKDIQNICKEMKNS